MKRQFKRLLISWIIHFLIIGTAIIIFSLVPYIYHVQRWGNYIFNSDGSPVTEWQYFLNSIHALGYAALFIFLVEINYRYIFKKIHQPLFIVSCLIIGMISFIPTIFVNQENVAKQGIFSAVEPILYMGAYAFLYSLIRDYYYQFQHKKDIRLQQSENELQALKAQLNPHFLFNSLNYLYGTALKEKAQITSEGIDRLSEMLRYTISGMYENYVPIAKEINFVKNYISLQSARIANTDDIYVEIQIHSADQDLVIAPLLLLPFIENAFKYGISVDTPCPIIIKINIEERILTMEVSNQIIEHHVEIKRNNTGIKNALKRLDLLYPNNYKLECKNTGTTYIALLQLHLNSSL